MDQPQDERQTLKRSRRASDINTKHRALIKAALITLCNIVPVLRLRGQL